MSPIASYYDLSIETIVISDKIRWLEQSQSHHELLEEIERSKSLKEQFEALSTLLSKKADDDDKIKTGFLHIINGYLKALIQIDDYPGYYPDLSQGMIIPGYLLGMILNDLKTNLINEGNFHPVSKVYMSPKEWPASDLKNILIQLREGITNIQFRSQMDGINFYEKRVRSLFTNLFHVLRELRHI